MIGRVLLAIIWLYQRLVSPLLGPNCRFTPTCSCYAAVCIERFGVLRGLFYTIRRLSRCHPFGSSGYDPPPPLQVKNGT